MDGLSGLKGLPAMKGLRRRMAQPERFPVFGRGPDWSRALITRPNQTSLFWPPPDDFVIASTSQTEWPPYAGLWLIFGGPISRLRQAPYVGMPGFWTYQTYVDQQFARAHNADFVIVPSSRLVRKITIRIQTENYHNFASHQVQQADRAQRAGLGRYGEVVDISDDDYLWDKSGRAVMYLLRQALSGRDPKVQSRISSRHQRRSRGAR